MVEPVAVEVARVVPGLAEPQPVSDLWGPAKPVLLVGPVAQREYWARRVRRSAGPGWVVAGVDARLGEGGSELRQSAGKVAKPGKSVAERGRRARWQVTDRSKFTLDFSVTGLLKDGMVTAELFTGPKYPDQPAAEFLAGAAITAKKKHGRGLFLAIDHAEAGASDQVREVLNAAIIAKRDSGEALTIVVTADLTQLEAKPEFDRDYLRQFNVQTAPPLSQQDAEHMLQTGLGSRFHWTPAALAEAEGFAEGRADHLQSLITDIEAHHPPGFITSESLAEITSTLVRDEIEKSYHARDEEILAQEQKSYLTSVLGQCDNRGGHSAASVAAELQGNEEATNWRMVRRSLVERGLLVQTYQGSTVPRDRQGLGMTRAAVRELLAAASPPALSEPTVQSSQNLARPALASCSGPARAEVPPRQPSQVAPDLTLPASATGISR